jgi:hypothetical protein
VVKAATMGANVTNPNKKGQKHNRHNPPLQAQEHEELCMFLEDEGSREYRRVDPYLSTQWERERDHHIVERAMNREEYRR